MPQKASPPIKRLTFLLLVAGLAAHLTGCLQDRPAVADRYEVFGVDVSHYQGTINWEQLAASGPAFAFMKATEGASFRDEHFDRNWQHAAAAGLRRGAYHFFRPEVSAKQQASNFFATVDLGPGDFPPVIDVEDRGRLSAADLIRKVRDLSDIFELRYGRRPILYTGQNFYNRYLAGRFDDHPLWLARYDFDEPVTVCGRDYHFWQYTDRGRMPGVKGRVDRNVFFGSYLDLALLCLPGANGGEELARGAK